jgi:hypothetical protein
VGAACSDGIASFEVIEHALLSFYLGVVYFCEVVCSCLAASWSFSIVNVSATVGSVVFNSQWSNNNHPLSFCGSSVLNLSNLDRVVPRRSVDRLWLYAVESIVMKF